MTVSLKFKDLNLDASLQKAIDEMNYTDCTPIQAQCIPLLIQGKDVAGLAQTGTGKTGAFLIPMIDRVLKSMKENTAKSDVEAVKADAGRVEGAENAITEAADKSTKIFEDWQRRQFILILVPTRELAEQVLENAEKLMKHTPLKAVSIYGGTSYDKQKNALRDGVEFIIATPGRLMDLYKEHLVDFKQVRAVIFDEADRMFDMGFQDDMKFILRRLPENRQFLLFSATLNFAVMNIAYQFGADPVEINVSKDQAKSENIDDEIYHVGGEEKPRFLLSLLKKSDARQVIIFSNFKKNVDRLAQFLTSNGLPAMGISSLMTQAQRTRVIAQFKSEGARHILVATDVAARGLDVLGVDLVVNYELPDDPENYVHRIGRTGRAGQKGKAISLLGDRDVEALQRIENYSKTKLKIGWMEDADLVDPKDMKPLPRESHSHSSGHGGHGGQKQGGFKPRHDRPRNENGPRKHDGPRPPRRDQDGPRRDHHQQTEGGPREHKVHAGAKPQHPNKPVKHQDNRRPHHSSSSARPQNNAGGNNPKSNRRPVKLKNRPNGSAQRPQSNGTTQAKKGENLGSKISNFVRGLFGSKSKTTPSKPTQQAQGHKVSHSGRHSHKPTRSSGKS